MRLWDRGRFGECGFDIRRSRLHFWLAKRAMWLEAKAKLWNMRLSCCCEPCLRAFLPWPFNW